MTASTMDRARVLQALGLGPVWRLRGETGASAKPTKPTNPALPAMPADSTPRMAITSELQSPTPSPPLRQTQKLADVAQCANPDVAALDWDALQTTIAGCRCCGLCAQRKQAVPGVGDRHADVLFVGEGPGAEEDLRGEPFVGEAGILLDAMLAAIGLHRNEKIFIANAVKCRPPGNRTPEAAELAACRPYLARQIALLRPKLIVALGRCAAMSLLQHEVKISAVRGKVLDATGIPLIVTYHPAYLLRNPADKAHAWADLCLIRRQMQTRCS